MTEELTPGMMGILRKVQALLNLAAKNSSPEEAASAASKAQELLEKYNLDAAMVGQANPEDGKREEQKIKGGFYQWQRDLWEAVAELHFCLYWTQRFYEDRKVRIEGWDGQMRTEVRSSIKNRHRLVGRVVNTRSAIGMAQYLEQAIDRAVKEHIGTKNSIQFSNYAVSFRKGAAARVIEKVGERFKRRLNEERKRQQRAEKAAASGASTATALVLTHYISAETDANNDFIHGEGWSARRRAEELKWRAEEAEADRKAEEEYTKWAAENPEEARKAEAKERKKRESRRYRYSAGPADNTDYGAYRRGSEAAEKISLDQQVGRGSGAVKRIG